MMTDMVDVQPLDLSRPANKFWLPAADHSAVDGSNVVVDLTAKMSPGAAGTATAPYAKLSVAIPPPRRYSNCSDNVSFAGDSSGSDRSPSISPAASSSGVGGDRFRPVAYLSDSDLSSSPGGGGGSDSESSDRVPSPLGGPQVAVSRGPATKRFLSKYIKEQVGKCSP